MNTIGSEGCACGDYKSKNLMAEATCRKSGGSGDWSNGVVHLLTYRCLTENAWNEIGVIVNDMLGYGADGIVLVEDLNLEI